ncbi:Mov34/MPN/PAD-1 family protein [Bradyrhizobium sp. LTSP849]|uniref:Mov34/MPN/PAD-1 family protein n=1 Tax=Bradyrhizobium sp. LTSP849 TaxID=1615890 RepID=UPI0018CDEB22|nr:Mov34/MPN/PAD-1 family protein [Bradyrhizobium sp. LTSP849]
MFGEAVDWKALALVRARAVARLVCEGGTQGYRFVEARRSASGDETLLVNVHVDRPQRFVHPLKATEPMALHFPAQDRAPVILALRDDFPDVPHTNPGHRSDPVSLCIDDRPWQEIKLNWTPSDFLVRIHIWLAKTARDELHGDQRAPEPLFVVPGPVVIVGREVIDAAHAGPTELAVHRPDGELSREVLVATSPSVAFAGQRFGIALIALTAARRDMGPLRFPPRTLGELADELGEIDLRGVLRERILQWVTNSYAAGRRPQRDPEQLGWQLGLLVGFPVAKEGGAEIGILELRVFFSTATMAEIGVALGCLDRGPDGIHGRLLTPSDAGAAASIKLVCGEVHYGLDRDLAALVSGEPATDSRRVALVGAGTVGSHVAANLAREGRFTWDVIDGDYLLPHNVPRHVLPVMEVGRSKAGGFARFLETALGFPDRAAYLVADVLSEDTATKAAVQTALGRADIIMDASASIAVSRFLSSTPDTARRISFFFNSEGTDAVLQIEPRDRSSSLRDLEAQHYAMTAEEPGLVGHLRASQHNIAYSGACRQATNRMSESQAALLSAAISLEIGNALRNEEGEVVVWRTLQGRVDCIRSAAIGWRRLAIADWSVALSESVVEFVAGRRKAALPSETGGVLLGVLDMEARSIHVSVALDAPSDSKGDRTGFERGIAGLRSGIGRTTEASAGQLVYVGEWHSHPTGLAATPSTKDLLQLAELAELLDMNGVPALMAIVNDDGVRVHCASLSDGAAPVSVVLVKEARG